MPFNMTIKLVQNKSSISYFVSKTNYISNYSAIRSSITNQITRFEKNDTF